MTDKHNSPTKAIWVWLALGVLAYLVLPWYAIQDANGLLSIGQVFSNEQAGNGVLQALRYGRSWLWLGLVALLLAAVAARMQPSRAQGTVLFGAGLLGALGLLLSGFLIGAKGWNFAFLNESLGELAVHQFGIGWGGFIVLSALVVLSAFGLARRGYFKGDLFIAAAVVSCGSSCRRIRLPASPWQVAQAKSCGPAR